jgi:tRNA-specific 2-thiouridylase
MRVAVAMSGGVDSSVAAHLLARDACDVVGVTLLLVDGLGDPDSAVAIADSLDIEHRILDVREQFEELVVGRFADTYAAGRTPNPCVWCNEDVKFGLLMQAAVEMGAETLATGHHARIDRSSGRPRLRRARDPAKDQTYFLYRVAPDTLERVVFPVGDLTKDAVRDIAADAALPVAETGESQEACFAAGAPYEHVVRARRPDAFAAGDITDASGVPLGRHAGIARYTVGQRKGLGLGDLGSPEPLYVTRIDAQRNVVVVGPASELDSTRVHAANVVWHVAEDLRALEAGDSVRGRCEVKCRYGMSALPGTYELRSAHGSHTGRAGGGGDRWALTLEIQTDEPAHALAPGQALVCYKDDAVIGGGTIQEAR